MNYIHFNVHEVNLEIGSGSLAEATVSRPQ